MLVTDPAGGKRLGRGGKRRRFGRGRALAAVDAIRSAKL
jgi:hypothetical protein